MATISAELQALIDNAKSFASDSYNSAESLISSAQTAASGRVTLSSINLDTTNIPDPELNRGTLFEQLTGQAVNYAPVFLGGWTQPTSRPSSPTLDPYYRTERPDYPDVPTALDTSTLFDFDRPVWDIDEFDETAPDIDVDVVLPTAVVPNWPDAPTPLDLTVRDAPTVTIPDFDEKVDVADPGAVPDADTTFEARYDTVVQEMRDWIDSYVAGYIQTYAPEFHTALSTLEAKIASDIAGGGTAIDNTIEEQIFNRSRDRTEAERERLDQEVLRSPQMRGFSEMPGEMRAALRRNQTAVAKAVSDQAAQTAIRRAELEQQHIQFVMTASQQLRTSMVQAGLSYAQLLATVNGQAITYAERVADTALRVYELQLRRYEVANEVYRTAAAVYETKIKAAFAELEAYKIEIDGKRLQGELQQIEVDLYARQVAAEESKINAYVQQIRALVEVAALDKLKVEIYGAQVDAYSARVQGKRAEYGAYESAIRGDLARVQAYGEEVGAYRAGVDAASAFTAAEKAHADTISDYNRNLLEEYRQELAAYGIDVDAEKSRVGAELDEYRERVNLYRTRIGVLVDEKRLEFEAARMEMEEALAQFRADLDLQVAQANLFTESIKLNAQTAMAGAEAFGRIAEGAVQAQNTLISLSQEAFTNNEA